MGPTWAAIAAVAACIALAAPAHATPEDDYLDVLSNTPGVSAVDDFGAAMLVGAGNAICRDLYSGTALDQVQGRVLTYPGATDLNAKAMVAAAQQTLCPDTK